MMLLDDSEPVKFAVGESYVDISQESGMRACARGCVRARADASVRACVRSCVLE
jgi:hypothetical protein